MVAGTLLSGVEEKLQCVSDQSRGAIRLHAENRELLERLVEAEEEVTAMQHQAERAAAVLSSPPQHDQGPSRGLERETELQVQPRHRPLLPLSLVLELVPMVLG